MTLPDLERLIGFVAIVVALILAGSLAMHGFDAWWSGRAVYPYELEMKLWKIK